MSRDVHSCTHWLRPRNSPPPSHLDSYYEGAIGQQDRRHLLVTPCVNQLASLQIDLAAISQILVGLSPSICRPREGFFHKFDFDTVLLALKRTAVCNLPLSLRFEQRTSCYYPFCFVSTLVQSAYMESCLDQGVMAGPCILQPAVHMQYRHVMYKCSCILQYIQSILYSCINHTLLC
jgi:hypothetical protein